MPEASVHEYGFLSFRKCYIWTPRYAWQLKTESIAKTMKYSADGQFWLRVGAPDPRHDSASLIRRDAISHVSRADCA